MKYSPKIQAVIDKYSCLHENAAGKRVPTLVSYDIIVLLNEIDRLKAVAEELRWQVAQLTGKTVGHISQSQSG